MSEKEKILQMVAEGKITVDDGERLLKAITESKKESDEEKRNQIVTTIVKKEKMNSNSTSSKKLKGKLIIQVDSSEGDNVKINLPLKLANFAMNMIPKEKRVMINNEGVDLDEILGNIGDLVDEVDGEDIINIQSSNGDNVRIYIES